MGVGSFFYAQTSQPAPACIRPIPTGWWRTRQYSHPTIDRFTRFHAMPLTKAARKPAAGKAPSTELAAVIGSEPVARPEAVKKMWEYIKAHNLQDPKDKRTIIADDKLRAVFGKDSAGMFELAGILGKHLG